MLMLSEMITKMLMLSEMITKIMGTTRKWCAHYVCNPGQGGQNNIDGDAFTVLRLPYTQPKDLEDQAISRKSFKNRCCWSERASKGA